MLELLTKYSLSEIFIFIVVLALAVKGFITFFDWAYNRLKQVFDKQYEEEKQEELIADKFERLERNMQDLSNSQAQLAEAITHITDKVNILVESDKDDIRSFITDKHHYFCYVKGWIDDYHLDCILKRYNHYKKEGGNSYIEGFVEEIRALPKQPPEDK